MNNGLFFYKKDGTPYPSGSNFISMKNLLQPIINSGNLGTQANGNIDSFSDLRVVFDPYRKRFWAIATGAFRGQVIDPTTGKCKTDCKGNCLKGAFTLPPGQRRSVIGLAVSEDEDPAGVWYLYWWDAAPGWGTSNPPYKPGDLADYPTPGINATTVDVSVSITDNVPCGKATHTYPHISLFDATAMAAGEPGSSVAGWHLYPVPAPFSTCGPAGLQNPDGSCPDPIIQPTLAHADPKASYFVGFESEWTLVIWRVINQLQPTVQSTEVPMSPFMRVPVDAPQKGTTAKIYMRNLNYSPLKAVWAGGALYIVTNDGADQTLRAIIRVLRLPTSEWPYVPSPVNVDSGADQVLGGSTGTSSFGWPAIEVAPGGDAVVLYTRTGPSLYADIRYNVWPHGEKDMLGGRILKYGEAAEVPAPPATTMRWGDLAGASVDFENGKEASAIWIAHEYARSVGSATTNTYGVWVGKIPAGESSPPPAKPPTSACPAQNILLNHGSCQHDGEVCKTGKTVHCKDPISHQWGSFPVIAECANGHWEVEGCPED
jgi:hypothetical protein